MDHVLLDSHVLGGSKRSAFAVRAMPARAAPLTNWRSVKRREALMRQGNDGKAKRGVELSGWLSVVMATLRGPHDTVPQGKGTERVAGRGGSAVSHRDAGQSP